VAPHLYIFMGFPGMNMGCEKSLSAGGIHYLIERVEEIGILTKDPIQLTAGNVDDDHFHLSDLCLKLGIERRWFPNPEPTESEPTPSPWSFGNSVTINTTTATREYKIVVEGTDLTEEEYLIEGEPMGGYRKVKKQVRHEGVKLYEARWRPGTCPQQDHKVHLTWFSMPRPLSPLGYKRMRNVVEYGADIEPLSAYNDSHFSAVRQWNGRPALVARA
jgi:hypothetical protein